MTCYGKPLITISGNQSLLTEQLSSRITHDLPQEGVEWQRSYGRSSKIVYLESSFVVLNEKHLMTESNEFELLSKPLLYTFWTDCSDVDLYKNTTKDEINSWVSKLRDKGINDWFIVHIDNSDTRKGNKSKLLPRSSVLDKIRNDFPTVKSSVERTITLIDSQKNDSKAIESYQQFLNRLRALLLQSYSKQLIKYEDYIRTEREKRNAQNWHFFHFFFLQEELAFAFEMLSLYDEALVQYDELDALFSQFVINSNVGQMPEWLTKLSQHYDTWHGLCLSPNVSKSLREQFKSGISTLLDLRNYLFSRQCELLFLLNKPWELASRALPFLQNCVNELNILEITMTSGGIACWVFLSALEILQKCERYSDSSQMESYSLHTVGLWSYARNKLAELGTLCGLMPGMKMTSECLHRVVNLIAGMGIDPRIDQVPLSPQERLKEALSGQEAFLKHYLEISELTMGTFKHIGRMRFARLIGKELAQLYLKMKRGQQAMPFLLDLEKVYLKEKWPQLLIDVRILLLQCYQMIGDNKREFKVRLQLSASNLLTFNDRINHFNEAEKLLNSMKVSINDSVVLRMEDILSIDDISLKELNYTVTNSDIELKLTLFNNFPKSVKFEQLLISLKVETNSSNNNLLKEKKLDKSCSHFKTLMNDQNKLKANENILKMNPKPYIETYHSPTSVGVKCNNTNRVLRRSDSHGFILFDKDPVVDDCSQAFVANNITLEPGLNVFDLNYNSKESGTFVLHQMIFKFNSIANIIETNIEKHICFDVIAEEPTLKVLQLTTLDGITNDILSGVEQSIVLQLNCGSFTFEEQLSITVKASRGLQLKLETDLNSSLKDEISFQLSNTLNPFQTFTIPLIIKSKLFAQKDTNSIEHELIMSWIPNGTNTSKWIGVTFHLLPPFISSYKLHTCYLRKFFEVLVQGVSKRKIVLSSPELKLIEESNGQQISLKGSLPKNDSIIYSNQIVHYLWEMIAKDHNIVANKLRFCAKYKLVDENINQSNEWENFECDYKLSNYQTLYTIKEIIEPQKGTEFCRAGSLCHLNVIITRIDAAEDHNSIMYEIISDQTLWNLSGRTAGVVTIEETDNYEVTFEVMPLISGFLPLPTVRLSKYLSSQNDKSFNNSDKNEAKLIAFEIGQIYNWSRGSQVHVLPSSGLIVPEI